MKRSEEKKEAATSAKNDQPGFSVTAAEAEQINAFKEPLRLVIEHTSRFRMTEIDAKVEACQNAYLANPSDENYDAFKASMFERELGRLVAPKLAYTVDHAERLLFEKIVPFVLPIIDRNLDLARSTLTGVTEEENQQHTKLFGVPIEDSQRISSARSVVVSLESLRADAKGTAAPSQIGRVLSHLSSFPISEP